MADTTTTTNERVIKTIIVIRNDTEANFEANPTLMLRKGEMAISISEDVTKPSKIKVGDGVHQWSELPYINGGNNSGTPGEGGVDFTPDGKILKLTPEKVLTLIGADTATAGQSFKISEDGTSIVWFTSADNADVEANKTLIDKINESLKNDYYNKTETDELFKKVFVFKGTVETKEQLDAIENPEVGWVYIVKGSTDKEGQLYVYAENTDGSGYWEDFPLAIEVDLSGYVLTTDFTPVKETVESIPETLIARLEAMKNEDGSIEIKKVVATKGEDGKYIVGEEEVALKLANVVANGESGLMSGADKAKLDMLAETAETGGQANVIENVTVGGEAVEVGENKTVNIPVAGEKYGVVKNHAEPVEGTDTETVVNKVVIAEDGTMSVPEITMDSLVEGDVIISGGGAGAW